MYEKKLLLRNNRKAHFAECLRLLPWTGRKWNIQRRQTVSAAAIREDVNDSRSGEACPFLGNVGFGFFDILDLWTPCHFLLLLFGPLTNFAFLTLLTRR